MKIEYEGAELTVEATLDEITVSRVVGRDRVKHVDVVTSLSFAIISRADEIVGALDVACRSVARRALKPCRCDYHYGWSDHAPHCQSCHVANSLGDCYDDD